MFQSRGKPDWLSRRAAEGENSVYDGFSGLLAGVAAYRGAWPGWDGSAMIFLALLKALVSCRDSREVRGQPITFSAERITRCSLVLSLTV